MSSVIEYAEMQRLRKAYEEHKRAERFHKTEADRLWAGYCAASVRHNQALARENEQGD